MRKKIIVSASVVATCIAGIAAYILHRRNKPGDFDDFDEELIIDNFTFYGYDITDKQATKVADMLTKMGLYSDVDVSMVHISEGGDDVVRDRITEYCSDIDYTKPVFMAVKKDVYYVWTGRDGSTHGLCVGKNNELVRIEVVLCE